MRKTRVACVALGLIAAASLGFGQEVAADEDPIVIGAAVALSGFVAPYDDGPQKAAQLAVKVINERGGVLGRQIEMVFADTNRTSPTAPTPASRCSTKARRWCW